MKKNIYQNIFLFLTVILWLSSCVSQKQIAYFQKSANQSDTIKVAELYIPKIQPGDILSIYVGSLNPMASSFFNPYSASPITDDNSASSGFNGKAPGTSSSPVLSQSAAPGFLVDASGTIVYPLLGSIKLSGLTTSQARDTLKTRLKSFLKEPTVNVRFLNYKISVMGEVAKPSVYVIPNETITLPEALSLAGDLTIFGKRDNVLVIRDNNGKKEFGRVDLNSRDFFTSPYYYLHANDVIYVEPGKGRVAQTDKTYQILPVILSALSFLSIIFVYSKR
ncbi:MAG: Polysaccharide biosynthesis/export protein [Mucilaginibacter sp.]|nr:Polysaccharide biosynthesis/export protein [Mucilaginibacter sp.]